MSTHLKLHSFTGTSDHDFTGLVPEQLIKYDGSNVVSSENVSSIFATNLSGGTIYSGSTNLYDIFLTSGDVSGSTVSAGSNVNVDQTGVNFEVSVVPSPSFEDLNVSGNSTFVGNIDVTTGNLNVVNGEIQSGGTDLYNIFVTENTDDITRVQPGTNIVTGGTPNEPIVSLVDSPSVNNFNASGTSNFTGVIQSGGTDLSNLFVTGSGTNGTIPLWDGATTITDSILTQNGTSGVTVAGDVYIEGNVEVLGTATTINTNDLFVVDNTITLNSGGTATSATGGGIYVQNGVENGVDASWIIDANGNWVTPQEITSSGLTVDGGILNVINNGEIQSGGTDLYDIFLTENDSSTASNGLTKTGNNITLGGPLTATTTIEGNNDYGFFYSELSDFNLQVSDGVTFVSNFTLNSANNTATLEQGSATGAKRLQLTQTNAILLNLPTSSDGGGSVNLGNNDSRITFVSDNDIVSDTTSLIVEDGFVRLSNTNSDIGGVVLLDEDSNTTGQAGMIRWEGDNFQGYNGTSWVDLDAQGDVTRVQPGTNIVTGGTANEPIVSLVDSPSVNNFNASGTSNFTGVIQSGGTDLGNIFLTTGDTITASNGLTKTGNNITLGGTLTASTTIDANTNDFIIEGNDTTSVIRIGNAGTGPRNIIVDESTGTVNVNTGGNSVIFRGFRTEFGESISVGEGTGAPIDGEIRWDGDNFQGYNGTSWVDLDAQGDVTRVQPGINIVTGGTPNEPIVSLVDSPTVNNFNASGTSNFTGVIQSGGTDLYNLFVTDAGVTGSGTNGTIPLWDGATTITDSILTQNGTSGVTVAGDVYIEGNVEVLGTATTINTNDLFVVDNTITLNSGGTATSATGGGIYIEDGVSNGVDASWIIDANGNWEANGGIQGTTVTATEFFSMTPYTDLNPATPTDNDAWFHSGATGTITLNYRVGGVDYSVELS